MGLSLNQVLILLVLLLETQARPGRSTIQRWIKAAGQKAGRVLKHLDGRCRALVLVGCLDEIFFHRRPVLVGVEPASMVWFVGSKADDRQGATWCQELQGWTNLRFVVSDAGTGLQAGIALVQQQRREAKQLPLEHGSDVFHTAQEARRVLHLSWNRVERLREHAEAATRQVCAGATAGPRRAGRGGDGPIGLGEGGGRLPPVRGVGSGWAGRPRRAAGVPSRWSLERPLLGGPADRLGLAPVVGPGVVQDAWLPPGGAGADVPGPDAPPVAGGPTG